MVTASLNDDLVALQETFEKDHTSFQDPAFPLQKISPTGRENNAIEAPYASLKAPPKGGNEADPHGLYPPYHDGPFEHFPPLFSPPMSKQELRKEIPLPCPSRAGSPSGASRSSKVSLLRKERLSTADGAPRGVRSLDANPTSVTAVKANSPYHFTEVMPTVENNAKNGAHEMGEGPNIKTILSYHQHYINKTYTNTSKSQILKTLRYKKRLFSILHRLPSSTLRPP